MNKNHLFAWNALKGQVFVFLLLLFRADELLFLELNSIFFLSTRHLY